MKCGARSTSPAPTEALKFSSSAWRLIVATVVSAIRVVFLFPGTIFAAACAGANKPTGHIVSNGFWQFSFFSIKKKHKMKWFAESGGKVFFSFFVPLQFDNFFCIRAPDDKRLALRGGF